MELLLLAFYAFIAWLIFGKFRWLPWNIVTGSITIVLPIIGLTVLILTLNIVAPASEDVRVIRYVVQIVPQVRGRVIDVPIAGNKPIKKGDVLFRIDPTPFNLQVKALEAQLVNAQGSARKLNEDLSAATAKSDAVRAQIDLAKRRVVENRQLVEHGAGDRFALEQAETNLKSFQADLAAARAQEAQVRAVLGATVDNDQAEVAQIRAQLESAKWDLLQTTVIAPANGVAINLQLRPGSIVTPLLQNPAMSFVEDDYQVIALFDQNELRMVVPGDEAEIALKTIPGKVLKARVVSVVWAQGQGQLTPSGTLPITGNEPTPAARFAVRLQLDEKERDVFLAAGARGHAAVYTDHLVEIQILRKVIIRVGAYINYLVLKV
ncbi:HlyD family secretion protein [Caballeronia telluris]|uniref:HlyD family secretion protein n=1 Tax=Caballeronia telluris TaxID=326475 RepID=A0A158I4Q7_9BURK|nr:HlyD family secretion protein [Caballeronia telluris]SAL51239.1 HlyD family secretion protein [Caballeronia telluris]